MPTATDPVQRIRRTWERLNRLPGGRWLFSRVLGWVVPYTGTIRASVVELRKGHATLRMRDRRRVRNHLRSIHAVALFNLVEITTGLAMNFGLPGDARGILTGFSIDYLKKGRGTLTAVCDCPVPETNEEGEYEVVGQISDESGDVVVRATARWLIGPATS